MQENRIPRAHIRFRDDLKSNANRVFLFVFLLLIMIGSLGSQVTAEDYARAERFLPQNVRKLLFQTEVKADWIGKTDRFWYKRESVTGKEFILVDPEANKQMPAFDHQRLAASLSRLTKTSYEHRQLPFDTIVFADDGDVIRFKIGSTRWTCKLDTYQCSKSEEEKDSAADQLISPDGRWSAFVRDHNLYLLSVQSGQEIRLTTDGTLHYEYAGYAESDTSWVTRKREGKKLPPLALWSPDSRKLITHRLDQRKVKELYLLQNVPADGSFRPVLYTYRYPFAGDQDLASAEYMIFDIAGPTAIQVQYEPQPIYCECPLAYQRVWWSADGKRAYFIFNERGDRALRLCEVDSSTGKTRVILKEEGSTYLDVHPVFGARPNVRDLGGGKEIVWFSERDGWAHLYLYDGNTGALIRQVTSGAWAVHEIKRVDESERWIYFTATGREEGRDPYYRHLYRAKLDGSKIELLTPEDGDHDVAFSPSGSFLLDTFSRVDFPPVSVLRTCDGIALRVLEKADIGLLLETGWTFPQRFCVKARDGTTNIFGVVYRSTTFDPSKTYPVIDAIYPGPQAIRTPKSFMDIFLSRDCALAELGFIVVTVDGLGTPFRSKAFHDFSYGNLGDAGGLPDHIAALRQLSARYSYLDLSRVGIYGHSGGGYAAARAILAYPEFYKVAVSSAGNHDSRGYVSDWLEKYQGLPGDDNYRDQSNVLLAQNLKGKLLLACGDLDDNVHPAMTLQLVDALIKANKDFDFLLLPNSNHTFRPHKEYFIRKTWDFFVKHLLGCEPPLEYVIQAESDGS